jgi:hypothetical protein
VYALLKVAFTNVFLALDAGDAERYEQIYSIDNQVFIRNSSIHVRRRFSIICR